MRAWLNQLAAVTADDLLRFAQDTFVPDRAAWGKVRGTG